MTSPLPGSRPAHAITRRGLAAFATLFLGGRAGAAEPSSVLLDRAFAAFFAGWRSGDWGPFLALCADDFIFQFPAGPQAGRHVGRAGLAAMEAWCREHARAGNRIHDSSEILRLQDGEWGVVCDRGRGVIDGAPYDGLHAIFMKASADRIVEFREYFGLVSSNGPCLSAQPTEAARDTARQQEST
ncbi:nuclear transport factor 2 family protein [Sphingomonas sp. MS122]|uniref:nuclear transport factor 2 family protein n=1 Tax=Sphingomonas sp. MS122 TaxID=3412683 RepID=UPI003C2C6B4D